MRGDGGGTRTDIPGGGGRWIGEGQKRQRSRVFERARPTPSCSCLPPTACNFLAKALMRGLARDGRSPRTSREPPGLKSLRSPARPFSPDSLLFSSPFFSLPLTPSLSHVVRVLPLFSPFRPLYAVSSFFARRVFLSHRLIGVSTEVVFTSCAPRGSATVYLNSDLRSDTGLKLAKEVSRCRCIQDTATHRYALGPGPRFQRRNDVSALHSWSRSQSTRTLGARGVVGDDEK